MTIALFHGRSLVSLAIRFMTRSQRSHAAFRFDGMSERIASDMVRAGHTFKKLKWISEGSVSESWQGGVKNSPSLNTLHTPGTPVEILEFDPPLTREQEQKLIERLDHYEGTPYNYYDIAAFVLRWRGNRKWGLFCSMMIDQACRDIGVNLFRDTQSWRVPPDWLGRTVRLKFSRLLVTA